MQRGFVPASKVGSAPLRFTPAQVEILRKVAAIWPGLNQRWPHDPRLLWDADFAGQFFEGGGAERAAPEMTRVYEIESTLLRCTCGRTYALGLVEVKA